MTDLRRVAATLLLAALPLAGCARDAGRAADSAAADSAAPSAAVPNSAPNSAPDTSTDSAAVTERGLGPLRVGMTIAEATAALGGALVVPANADTSGCDYVQWRGAPPGVMVMVDEHRVARVDVDSAGVATAAGARVGDSEERVKGLYPGRVVVSPHKYEDGNYLTVTPDASDTTYAIVFETSKGRVTRYRAGRRPQVEYVEGCS